MPTPRRALQSTDSALDMPNSPGSSPNSQHKPTLFRDAANVVQIGSHEYRANIAKDWSYGPAAHGGYLIAIIWRAIGIHFGTTLKKYSQPETFTFHIEFLRPCGTGEATLTIKDVRLGRATSTVHVSLAQKGSERCVVYASNSSPSSTRNALSIPTNYTRIPLPPPIDHGKVLNTKDPNWIRYDVPYSDIVPNQALTNVIFTMLRRPSREHPRVNQQWICLRHPSATWTNETLGILLDMNVPPPEQFFPDNEAPHNYFSMGARAEQNEREGRSSYDHPPWAVERYYPTVSMSIEVKRQLPPEGCKWLYVRWETREVVDGRFDADIEVWDTQDRLVANASSLWYLVDAARSPAGGLARQDKKGNVTGQTASTNGASKI